MAGGASERMRPFFVVRVTAGSVGRSEHGRSGRIMEVPGKSVGITDWSGTVRNLSGNSGLEDETRQGQSRTQTVETKDS
jgi:hypothetical protein